MRIIDLSHEIFSGMPVYPGDPEVLVEPVESVDSMSWQVSRLSLGTHTGTHVDAFLHMVDGGASIDRMGLERFMGPAQLVHVDDEDAPFPEGLGLLFDGLVDESFLERIIACGVPFVAGDLTEAMEQALLSQGIVTFTDLVNLDQLPYGETFFFIGLPLKIREGDGSPVRAVAVLGLV